jgi:predicted nucleotide-binding protein (sugar kinase/HSP70/actin superfamily)
MGNLALIIRDLAVRFDLDYVETPPFSENTVRIGAALAPEFACLPLKAVLGNFVEVVENGADTLVTSGGHGPCRFGYYSEIQRRILEREGVEFRMLVLEPITTSLRAFYNSLRELIPREKASLPALFRELKQALDKMVAFDVLDKRAMALRGLEVVPGAVDAALAEARGMMIGAFTAKEIREARCEAEARLRGVRVDTSRSHLKIGIVGEIFVVLEPFFNFDIERWLGRRGAVVERATSISDRIYPRGRHPVFGYDEDSVAAAARPFLNHKIGGDGLLSVGATVIYARRGFDAVVHLLPFTCMPEVIAKGILGRVSSESGLPVLSLSIDEQTGRAGVETRLEALMDLAWSNRRAKERSAEMGVVR